MIGWVVVAALAQTPEEAVRFHGRFEPWELSVEAGGGFFAFQSVARASVEGRFRPKKWFATGIRIGGGSTIPWESGRPALPLVTVDALAEFHGGVFFVGVLAGPWFMHIGNAMQLIPRVALNAGIEVWRFTLSGEFGAMLLAGTLHITAEGRLSFRIF